MTGKVHVICGVSAAVTATIACPTLNIAGAVIYPAIGILAAFPGSLLPDIDISQSKMGSKHPWLSKHLKHRGITHTLLLPLLVVGLFILARTIPILPSLLFGFEIGYVAHIVADLFNKKGVPLLWPFTSAHLHVACVKTSSKAQQVIFVIFWEVICLIVITLRYDLWNTIPAWFSSLG